MLWRKHHFDSSLVSMTDHQQLLFFYVVAPVPPLLVQVLSGDFWRHDRDEGQTTTDQPILVHWIQRKN